MVTRSRITGIGTYLPPRVVTNADLAERMDTSDDWIRQRTGIRQRHWVDPGTTTSDLARDASIAALKDAGVTPGALDMIVVATLSPDHFFPGTACFLQAKLDAPGIPAIDVRQQCSGFIYAVSIVDQFIRTGAVNRALVVGAEVHSKGLDVTDAGRDVAVLFGDGAGAIVMESTGVDDPASQPHVLSTHLHADGRFAEELWLSAPGMAHDRLITHDLIDRGEHYPKMNGRTVFVNAVKRMGEAIVETLDHNRVGMDDVDLFVFHQANLRINEAVAERMGIPAEKVYNTIDRFGNTTAATIPIGLGEAREAGRLEPGMLVAGAAFGSGFTWASMLVRW